MVVVALVDVADVENVVDSSVVVSCVDDRRAKIGFTVSVVV